MKTVLVVTSTHREFSEFVQQKDVTLMKGKTEAVARDTRYLWIRDLDYMRGMRPDGVYFVGQWFELENSEDIETYARIMKAVEPDMELHGLNAAAK